jgi:poly(hydroxyalkanoate) depolymerase family esterase
MFMPFKKFLAGFFVAGLLTNTAFASSGASMKFDGQIDGTEQGTRSTASYKNQFGSRQYTVFVPQNLNPNAGLLVVLHGCFLTGDQMATGTEFNKLASAKGFVVLYPEQTYQDNSWKCWNWFKPENQRRDDGELSIIVGMTQETIKKYGLNAGRVFVTGISAGGAMASNLLGCYSDVFQGGMIHSGLEFAAAQNEQDAHTVTKNGPTRDLDASAAEALQCSPPRNTLIPVIVVHGQDDSFVNTVNADRITLLFEKINTTIFQNNGGNASQITHQESRMEQDGHKLSANVTQTLFNSQMIVEKVMVQGMGHAWSGGQPTAPYMEPRGIGAAKLLVDTFFP